MLTVLLWSEKASNEPTPHSLWDKPPWDAGRGDRFLQGFGEGVAVAGGEGDAAEGGEGGGDVGGGDGLEVLAGLDAEAHQEDGDVLIVIVW